MNIGLDGPSAGRVAIVTGGSRGVGRATIRRLAASGCAVVVNYLHDQHAAESTVAAILAGNSDAVAVRADVADDLDVERLFAETIAAFGGIDVVVHAAGSRITATPLAKADLHQFDALVRINTRSTFIVNRGSPSPSQRRCDRQPVQLSGGFIADGPRPRCSNQGRHKRTHASVRARAA
jgi:3-oxoacyl-[acyl-carrier protein] reductase